MLFDTAQQVIFIEDDEALRTATVQTLELAGLTVRAFASADTAIAAIDARFGGVIVSDIRMRGMDGLQLFAAVRAIDADIPVILITGHADVTMAVGALREGAFDFLTKPFAADYLVAAVRRALEKRLLLLDNRRLRALAEAQEDMGPLIGDSPAIAHLRSTIRQLAALDIDVLVEGETGTGKKLVARMLHRLSQRRNGPLVAVNCSALPVEIAESTLFGHAADTPPHRALRRGGQIAASHQGLLLLEDIDSLAAQVQAGLLRVLEDRSVQPPGASAPRPIDLRVMATCRTDLESLVRQDRFRSDLFYRLNAVRLRLPPLRARREDVPQLFALFVAEARKQTGVGEFRLTDAMRRHLTGHDWPGNARELKNYATRCVLGLTADPPADNAEQPALGERLRRFEATIIEDALRATGGNVSATVARLQVPRKTLYEKMARLAIDPARFRHRPD
jgi:two-component system C4-dicarboxylate transport response regulator DctD